ncbi:MAG TPA: hypothetical protein VM617_05950 [Thermoanaerobaculia bacterium]|nr:hypothetical protein [Thermoanaerobaculia bacterium]
MPPVLGSTRRTAREESPPRGGGDRRRRLAVGALGVLVLAWAAVAFLLASADFLARLVGPPQAVGVTAWSPGEYASERLADFLGQIEPRVPPGRVVLFSAPAAAAEEELFLSLWGAYHLPRHRVIRARHPAAGAGEYLVVYDGVPPRPPGEELFRHPVGALYRLPAGAR